MRLRRTTLAAAAVASIGLLGACTSQPSPKAVVNDVIESLTVPGGAPLPQAQQDCMLAVVDSIPGDELEDLGNANRDAAITAEGGGDEDMQAFIARLQECGPDGSTAAPTESSTSTTDAG